jgi:hypothetical protein
MRKEFNEICRIFNTQTIDDFLAELKRLIALKKKFDNKRLSMPHRMIYTKIKANISFFNELLYIKKNASKLKSIDYYCDNFVELLDIVDM